MARPLETRWEERRDMTTAEHLKVLDYDQDEIERRQIRVESKLDKILMATLLAVLGLAANLANAMLGGVIKVGG